MKSGIIAPATKRFRRGAAPAWLAAAVLAFGGGGLPRAALAQDDAQDEEAEFVASEMIDSSAGDETAQRDEGLEEIVVTGSRLRRSTYSSVSPLQIISGQISREIGLTSAADILQESTAASGQQIDLTFGGFVLDNGPGTSTISLRGLGANRTLVLINGRRLAPGGVEGAPSSPDLNTVPASLVQQYDLLLDGASSVYGSDAIAGVTNIILRKDFEGLELDVISRIPEYGNGESNTLRLAWGRNYDRGFFGVGVEHTDNQRVALRDRPWTDKCETHLEIDQNGDFRTRDIFYEERLGMDLGGCRMSGFGARLFVPGTRYRNIYHTPGASNIGIPSDFSIVTNPGFDFPVDSNGDGIADINFADYNLNASPTRQSQDLFPASNISNLMSYGEYTFDGEANLTPYYELMYATRNFYGNRAGSFPIFPEVPALNPFNPCNPNQPNGADCGLARDSLYTNPNYVADFSNYWLSEDPNCFGAGPDNCTPSFFGHVEGASGPISVTPVVWVNGDRDHTQTATDQLRFVFGTRGDLPALNFGSISNWSFDTYVSYSKSSGQSFRNGIREDRLDLSLGAYSSTGTPCENDSGEELLPDAATGCVPVNVFAPSLYTVGDAVGDFATQQEFDYLIDLRYFDTVYEQTVASVYASGDVFELQGGDVALGVGVEWRRDQIDSIPNDVARDGLLFGFFSDGGAVGRKDTKEAFAEIELPLLGGLSLAEELTLNLSSRLTNDEYYDNNWTESVKVGYRPISSLLLRGTYGTAFRAPNLRDLFLRGTTSFFNVFDPCYLPGQAFDGLTGAYDPALDDREDELLANCRANGVDPFLANNDGFNNFSVEVAAGGSLTLDPEESESYTYGFAWRQPFTDAFNLSVSATYYEIEVTNTIIDPGAQFVINDCYFSATGSSVFCGRIGRDFSDPTDPRIQLIDGAFLNRDLERARGVDVNVAFNDTWTVFERPFNVGLDVNANRGLERSTRFTNDDGSVDENQFQGLWGFPDWTAQMQARVQYDRWRLIWETRFRRGVNERIDFIDDFGDAYSSNDVFADTCRGPENGDVFCRDYADAGNYFLNSASLYYSGDRWRLGFGVRNVFDTYPPQVNFGGEGGATSINNTPIGYGYNLNGRSFFLDFSLDFGGGE